MRKWHRWLAVLFGVFLMWISATGVLSQIGSLVNKGGFASESRASAAAAAPPGFTCPETMTCRPKPKPSAWNVGLLHHLHSGESFGSAGIIVSILAATLMLGAAVASGASCTPCVSRLKRPSAIPDT